MDDLKSLQLLWLNLVKHRRYAGLYNERDLKTFKTRSGNEGLNFLTVTLPGLAKSLDQYHSTLEWVPPVGFKTDEEGFPIFLGDAVKKAVEGSSSAVEFVRQMSYLFYKLEVPYDQSIVDAYLDSFIETDKGVGFATGAGPALGKHLERMRLLIQRVLCNADPMDIRPCHGSGSTACRTKNSDKWHRLRYYPILDETYCYSDYFFFSQSHLIDEMGLLEEAEVRKPEARVCLVPKDSRGPRIISCEPAELLYIQKGLMRLLYRTIETNPLTRGQVNFSDQGINRDLARMGSIYGHLSTLDLKDASDKVSLDLVRAVFPPRWIECFEACRSEVTVLPDGRRVELNKFAPMGSACCFPVEALVFWASARASVDENGAGFSSVFVYGDDLIVESQLYDPIVAGLEMIGLTINISKSYRNGPFRESCGGDFHNGVDVTPVRLRKFLGSSSTALAAGADFCNLLLQKFGDDGTRELLDFCQIAMGVELPRTKLPLPGTLRMNPSASNDALFRRRWNPHLQRHEYRVITLISKALAKQPPNWGELLRKELTRDIRVGQREPYEHRLARAEASMEPGIYAATQAVHKKWDWVWLGEPDVT